MNIQNIKNITDVVSTKEVYLGQDVDKKTYDLINKGYVAVDFPGGPYYSNANIPTNETLMEFVIYDANNQILEQKDYGIVRYIPFNQFSNYLIPSTNVGDTTQNNGGYLVDVKTLIQEAGFTTGYFRVQINFVRNRVGSNNNYDKVFVQEISPTRQEIRVLPYVNKSVVTDSNLLNKLNEQYQTFADGKFEVDQSVNDSKNYVDFVKMSDANSIILPPDPSTPEGQFLIEFQKEFGNSATSIVQSAIAGISTIDPIGDNQYYKSKQDIINAFITAFKNQLTNVLPKRNLINTALYNTTTANSLDALTNIVQTLQADLTYGLPAIKRNILTPTAPPPPPPAITLAPPPDIIPNADTPLALQTVLPPYYQYELTECFAGVDKILGISTTIKYSAYTSFVYNGKCYHITSFNPLKTTTFIATNIDLETLTYVYPTGCGPCLNALLNGLVVIGGGGQIPFQFTVSPTATNVLSGVTSAQATVTFATSVLSKIISLTATPQLATTFTPTTNYSSQWTFSLVNLATSTNYTINFTVESNDATPRQLTGQITFVTPQAQTATGGTVNANFVDIITLSDCLYPATKIYGFSAIGYVPGESLFYNNVCYNVESTVSTDITIPGFNKTLIDFDHLTVPVQYYANCARCQQVNTIINGGTTPPPTPPTPGTGGATPPAMV